MRTGWLTKELGLFVATLVLCGWWVGSVFAARRVPTAVAPLPPVPAPQALSVAEVPLRRPLLYEAGAARAAVSRNPFAAPDPWSDPVPEPIAPPKRPRGAWTLPLVVVDEQGRPLSRRAPLIEATLRRARGGDDGGGR